jgi:hypothetical protein
MLKVETKYAYEWEGNTAKGCMRRRERAGIYGDIAQPRSHLLKERLMADKRKK